MAALLSPDDIATKLQTLQGWRLSSDGKTLSKELQFADFKAAFAFMTHVAMVAETMDHHPDWSNVYNTVCVKLSTHDAGGVTERDITLAQAIERILGD
ncbi:4a-hydroxytetrahydrobiopterin dehydratase [Magnetovibrio sp. PR-2]|uniref:4a-hydroxytetrahydrobiopterin dehydratase n=1 Tax=Magnetovibrio sp. PR-2 TaxID=3120356 RepID=UPI002FCE14DC